MTSPAMIPPTTWTVTGQTEQTQINPAGSPVRGVQVFYTTGAGHQGSVFVPYVQYTQENVRNLVQDAAARMDVIGALQSGPAAS